MLAGSWSSIGRGQLAVSTCTSCTYSCSCIFCARATRAEVAPTSATRENKSKTAVCCSWQENTHCIPPNTYYRCHSNCPTTTSTTRRVVPHQHGARIVKFCFARCLLIFEVRIMCSTQSSPRLLVVARARATSLRARGIQQCLIPRHVFTPTTWCWDRTPG